MWHLKCEMIYFIKVRDGGMKGGEEVLAKIQNLKSQKFVIMTVFLPVFLKWSVKIKWKTKPLAIGFLIYMENCGKLSNIWQQLLEPQLPACWSRDGNNNFSSVGHFYRNFLNFVFRNIPCNNLAGCGKLIFTCPLRHV